MLHTQVLSRDTHGKMYACFCIYKTCSGIHTNAYLGSSCPLNFKDGLLGTATSLFCQDMLYCSAPAPHKPCPRQNCHMCYAEGGATRCHCDLHAPWQLAYDVSQPNTTCKSCAQAVWLAHIPHLIRTSVSPICNMHAILAWSTRNKAQLVHLTLLNWQ